MALEITKVFGPNDMPSRGIVKRALGTIAFDTSYPTGGESVDTEAKNKLGLTHIHGVFCDKSGGYSFEYDKTNGKLIAYSGTSEVADTTDLSALTAVRAEVWGTI